MWSSFIILLHGENFSMEIYFYTNSSIHASYWLNIDLCVCICVVLVIYVYTRIAVAIGAKVVMEGNRSKIGDDGENVLGSGR